MLEPIQMILSLLAVPLVATDYASDCNAGDSCGVQLLQSNKKFKEPRALVSSQRGEQHRDFDCAAYPSFCKPPFNCQNASPVNIMQAKAPIARNGQPNLQSWCSSRRHLDYASQCIVDGDLVRAGKNLYKATKEGQFGPDTYELDGSYCFIEGHCLNTAVTENTTLEEAANMCDARYGHERWTSFGSPQSKDGFDKSDPNFEMSSGYPGADHTTPYLLLACAMGNYHCDVVYCRETYCKDQYLVEKYSHFLHEYGWDRFTEPWFRASP